MSTRIHRLLIVYASQSGGAAHMAQAVEQGARAQGAEVRLVHGTVATLFDLLWCDALIVATPENFGYMAGAVKDFFDRTFSPAQGKVEQLPYAVVVRAGNDGTFAVAAIERIARGYPLRKVAEPVMSVGAALTDEQLSACTELGEAMVAGLSLGIFGRPRDASDDATDDEP